MAFKTFLCALAALTLTACASAPPPAPPQSGESLSLPDSSVFAQKDERWASERMGGSGAPLEDEGCLVTAVSMALTNLGYKTNPGDFNAQLKRANGYTGSGLLIWNAIDRITNKQMTARYYNHVNDEIIQDCMRDGFYPMARFILPSGRTHWAMIVKVTNRGYHMRDPLHPSSKPLIFARGVDGFKAVRCVGRAD